MKKQLFFHFKPQFFNPLRSDSLKSHPGEGSAFSSSPCPISSFFTLPFGPSLGLPFSSPFTAFSDQFEVKLLFLQVSPDDLHGQLIAQLILLIGMPAHQAIVLFIKNIKIIVQ